MDLFPSHAPLSVNLGLAGSVVTNLGPGTVTYDGGTLQPSALATLFGVQRFSVDARAVLSIVPANSAVRMEGGGTIFIGENDPADGASEGDMWIDLRT